MTEPVILANSSFFLVKSTARFLHSFDAGPGHVVVLQWSDDSDVSVESGSSFSLVDTYEAETSDARVLWTVAFDAEAEWASLVHGGGHSLLVHEVNSTYLNASASEAPLVLKQPDFETSTINEPIAPGWMAAVPGRSGRIVSCGRYESADCVVRRGPSNVLSSLLGRTVRDSANSIAVAVGDIDGDSLLDVAFGNGDSLRWASHAVLHGNTNYTLEPTRISATPGPNPTHMELARIDADGLDDIVMSYLSTSPLVWYDSATFTRHLVSVPGAVPVRSFIVVDTNDDGAMDIITAGLKVHVLINDGTGSFSIGTEIPLASEAVSVAFCDVNGDTDPDLVVAQFSADAVYWYESASSSSPAHPVVTGIAKPIRLDCGDVDSDGDNDIVTASQWGDGFTWQENEDGAGNFTSHSITTAFSQPISVQLADSLGRGCLDILAASRGDATVQWFMNDDACTGDFATDAVLTGELLANHVGGSVARAANLSHDKPLFALAPLHNGLSHSVGVFPHIIGSTLVSAPPVVAVSGEIFLQPDWHECGTFYTVDMSSGATSRHCGLSLPTERARKLFVGSFVPNSSSGRDILVLTDNASSELLLFEYAGAGQYSAAAPLRLNGLPTRLIPEHVHPVTASDVYFVTETAAHLLQRWHNGTTQTVHECFHGWNVSESLVASFGIAGSVPDVVARCAGNTTVQWLQEDDQGTLNPLVLFEISGLNLELRAGDLDGDSTRDLFVGRAVGSLKFSWVLHQGGRGAGAIGYLYDYDGTTSIAADDRNSIALVDSLDVNGGADIVSDGGVALQIPSLASLTLQHLGPSGWDVRGVDLDLDTHIDVVYVSNSEASVIVRRGFGNGDFGPPVTLFSAANLHTVEPAQLNADEFLDLVISSSGGQVWVLYSDGAGAFGFLPGQLLATFPIGAMATAVGDAAFGDDEEDVVLASTSDDKILLFPGRPDDTVNATAVTIAAGIPLVYSIELVDLDLDLKLDILLVQRSTGNTVAWLRNTGTNTSIRFGPLIVISPALSNPFHVTTGRFGGDYPGVVVSSYDDSTVRIFSGTAPGVFSSEPIIVLSDMSRASFTAVADLNSDGLDDLIVAASGDSTVYIFLGQAEPYAFADPIKAASGNDVPQVQRVSIADVQEDGILDILAIGSTFQVNSLCWLESRLSAVPDDTSTLSCVPSRLEISSSRPVSSTCTLRANLLGLPLNTRSSSFVVTLQGNSRGHASVSALTPALSRSSVFTFFVAASQPVAVTVRDGVSPGASVTFFFPPPVIVPHSLQLLEGAGSSSNGEVALDSNTDVVLSLGVTNLGTDPTLVRVTYGPDDAVGSFECEVLSIDTDGLTCRTEGQEALGSSFVPLRFEVVARGSASEPDSTNQLTLASSPQVTSVSGCPRDDSTAGSTHDCPLQGGRQLVVRGVRFNVNGTTSILVGGRICRTLSVVSDEELVCSLPRSSGGAVVVVAVTTRSDANCTKVWGSPRSLVSYVVPSVVALRGCGADRSTGLHLVDCPRAERPNITVIGENLGSVDGQQSLRILVGGEPCTNLSEVEILSTDPVYDPTKRQRALSCRLPTGVLTDQLLTVLDPTGQPSETRALVSYVQCPVGSFGDGLDCKLCGVGRFADREGRTVCEQCTAGRASSRPGSVLCDLCEPGKFANRTGLSECDRCSPGTALDRLGGTVCKPCEPGSFANELGLAECTTCALGSVSDAGATACTSCPSGTLATAGRRCDACRPGTVSADPADEVCAACPAGKHAARSGQAACDRCVPGRYSPTAQSTECFLCPTGRAQHRANQSSCDTCPPGFVSPQLGQQVCTACDAGSFSELAQSTSCAECAVGTFSSASNSSSCDDCPRNTQASVAGSAECTECPPLSYTISTRTRECSTCPPGRYAVFEESPDPRGLDRIIKGCRECPSGASCQFGAVVASVNLWVAQSQSGEVQALRCLPGRCEQCPILGSNAQVAATSCCSPNRKPAEKNPMCGQCQDGYVEWGGECIECEEANVPLLIFLVLALWALISFLHFAVYQRSNPIATIFFYFVQMSLLSFGAETDWLAWTALFDFNPFAFTSGGSCVAPWSPVTQMMVSALTPLLSWVLLAMTAVLHGLGHVLRGRQVDWAQFRAPYWRSCIACFLFSYNAIAKTSLSYFECVEVVDKFRVVRTNPAIDCDSTEYERARPVFLIACVCFVVLGPLLTVWWLRRPSSFGPGKLSAVQRARYNKIFGVLFDVFRGQFDTSDLRHYWSVVVLVRRVMIVAVSVTFVRFGHETRYAALTLAHMLALLLHTYVRPFANMTLAGEPLTTQEQVDEAIARGLTVVRVNHIETVSLLLLASFSSTVGATNPPFTFKQSVGFSVVVFFWMLVLLTLLLWRICKRVLGRQSGIVEEVPKWKAEGLPSASSSVGVEMTSLSTARQEEA